MEYKIGSFNMCRFGKNAKKDFAKVAEIITNERLDVVAMQEIFSEGQGVKKLLSECINYELYNWDFCFGSPKESADYEKIRDMIEKQTRGEGYVYLWKRSKFKLLEYKALGKERVFDPRIVSKNDAGVDCSGLARAPYYIRLQPKYGGFYELRLINIHIFYGNTSRSSIEKRTIEYEILTKDIYPHISTRAYGQNRTPYTIAMGDYNLNLWAPGINTLYKNCYIPSVYSYAENGKSISIYTVQEQLSTLLKKDNGNTGYANNFDHFTYSPELSQFVSVSYETVDAVNKYCNGDYEYYLNNISDHLPVVMTVNI